MYCCHTLFKIGIVNLDNAKGTHWVAYAKRDNHVIYFDSLVIFDRLKNSYNISEMM